MADTVKLVQGICVRRLAWGFLFASLPGGSLAADAAPTWAQNIPAQIQLCNDDTADLPLRIDACTAVLTSDRVPDFAPFFMNRGEIYAAMGQYARAIDNYDEVIGLDPRDPVARYRRGNSNYWLSEYDRALSDFDEAIRLEPEFALSYNDKAWVLATAVEPRVRNGVEAVAAATRAVALADTAAFRDTLAAAYAEDGQFESAAREQRRAIELLRDNEQDAAVPDFESRLTLYELGLPYHR